MDEEQALRRTAGVRLSLEGRALSGVLRLKCPALSLETVDVTPLDLGYRRIRPGRRSVGELDVTALLRPADPGQAALIAGYAQSALLRVTLTLPAGPAITYRAFVRQLRLGAERPGAPALLAAQLQAADDAEVSP